MPAVIIKYELYDLDEFISEQIAYGSLIFPLPQQQVKRWHSYALEESKKIRKAIITQTLSLHKQKQLELYIQHHQGMLIKLSNLLYRYTESIVFVEENSAQQLQLKDLYLILNKQLLDLLHFMEHYFAEYWDKGMELPLMLKQDVYAVFHNYIQELKALLHPAPPTLTDIILTPYMRMDSAEPEGITYHHLQYCKQLYLSLSVYLNIYNNGFQESALLYELVALNFNLPELYQYYTIKIATEINELEDIHDQMKMLAENSKQLKQLNLRMGLVYDTAYPEMRQSLVQWLEEEYHYQQLSLQPTLPASVQNLEPSAALKIPTSLTVEQLGLLLRLLRRSKVFKMKNQSAMLRFFADHFTTLQKDSISVNNLKNQYYSPDSKTFTDLQDLLHQFLKDLKALEQETDK